MKYSLEIRNVATKNGNKFKMTNFLSFIVQVVITTKSIFTSAQPLGDEIGKVGSNLFSTNPGLEASGLVWIADAKAVGSGLLAGVDDSGSVFMVNPDDDDEYYVSSATGKDLEGITYDPFLFTTSKHVYVIEEREFQLIRYSYSLSAKEDHILTIEAACITDLSGALPCPTSTNQGLESLALFAPSSPGVPAQFMVGLQSNGVIYRVDATGASAGLDTCIDVSPALSDFGRTSDISASHYSSGILYNIYDSPRRLAAISVETPCLNDVWGTPGANYEGFTINGNVAYIASDESPSSITEFDWTPPTFDSCYSTSHECSFSVCEGGIAGGPSACSAPSTSAPTSSPVVSSPSPTPDPTENNCSDSTDTFSATKPEPNGWTKQKTCGGWVNRKSTAWRCKNVGGVKEACALTCTNCCVDATETFVLLGNGREKTCSWAAVNPTVRCRKAPTRQMCAVTCGECEE